MRRDHAARAPHRIASDVVRRRASQGRGDLLFTCLMCGVPLLLVGIVATGVSLFNPPPQSSERVWAGLVGVMGIVFGSGFIAMLLPERWHVGSRLWRWCGWLVAVVLVGFAVILLRYPATADSSRAPGKVGAVLLALGALYSAAQMARLWLRTRGG
jgi:hypothetical protein